MDDEKLCLISIGLVIVIFAGLAGMTYVDEEGWPWEDDKKNKDKVLLIQEGDEVSVEYTGRLIGAAGDPGPVFDTSIADVARDDSIPKTASFMERPTYDDLTFTVGSGQMIKGFEDSVINKKEGDTYTVAIPPEKGYGISHPELILEVNTTQKISLRETLAREDFEKLYPMVALEDVETFIHPFWQWDVSIVSYDPEEVVIWHQPVYGERYLAFPWNVTILDVSTEENIITLHHNIEEIDDDVRVPFFMIRGNYPDWAEEAIEAFGQEPAEGFVTSKGGVISIDFNGELAGKTLLFIITIKTIKRA
jgi:FKBP-type peptidyl-prolyl cis-trans isomerase 2